MVNGWAWTESLRRFAGVVRRSALLRFVALGALLFAADVWWEKRSIGRSGSPEVISLAAQDLVRLRRQWTAAHGLPPTPQEEKAMVERALDRQILEREAVRLGFDRDDRLVRDRLVKLGSFLELSVDSDAEGLEREARALGLQRNDAVIRRYLTHLMQIALAGTPPPPTEAEVRQRYARSEVVSPSRIRLAQVYLGRDAAGVVPYPSADRLLGQLRARGVGPDAAGSFGEPFASGAQLGPASVAELERALGPEFAAAVATAPSGQWSGPIPSVYGVHLVWVRERLAAGKPQLDAVRNRIAWDLTRERQTRRLRDGLRQLRQQYRVALPVDHRLSTVEGQ